MENAEGVKQMNIFAAYNNKEIAVLIALQIFFASNAEIYWVGVKPDYHLEGIGKALIDTAEEYYATKQCKILTVEKLTLSHYDLNNMKTYHFLYYCRLCAVFSTKAL